MGGSNHEVGSLQLRGVIGGMAMLIPCAVLSTFIIQMLYLSNCNCYGKSVCRIGKCHIATTIKLTP